MTARELLKGRTCSPSDVKEIEAMVARYKPLVKTALDKEIDCLSHDEAVSLFLNEVVRHEDTLQRLELR